MHNAFINEIAINTFLRPSESATEPHAYAPTIIPINMIELSHPFVCVFKSKSHCAEGRMNDIEMTSISSDVLTKPHIASNMQWNFPYPIYQTNIVTKNSSLLKKLTYL